MSARSIAVVLSLLALAACGGEDDPRADAGFPADPYDAGATGGATTGFTGGTSTGGLTTGSSTGGTTGATTGGSSGASTGASTGVSSGVSTGVSSGVSTGVSSGVSTGVSSGVSTGSTTGPVIPPIMCPNGMEPLAAGIKISEVALFQAVKIPLVTGGTWVSSRNAQVVQGKKTLVRIYFSAPSSAGKMLRGVVGLDNGSGVKYVSSTDMAPSAASTDATLTSTFNINVDGADIGPSTKVSFAILDPSCPATTGPAADARFPASGLQDLMAEKINKMKIVVVPIIVNGLTPDTSAAQLENMRKDLVANYPIPDAVLSVRTGGAVTSSTQVGTQAGWSEVLGELCNVRSQDKPAADVYYYGLITPAATFQAYCTGGCVLGIAQLLNSVSANRQCGIGVGWLATSGGRSDYTATTFTHEEGHNHGRSHVACNGEAGTDASYPYKSPAASIGSWGWDSRTGTTLYDPAKQKDYMSYCSPTWTSDYTYKAVGARSIQVNKTPAPQLPDAHTWHGMLVKTDGTNKWSMTTEYTPGDEFEPADVLDEDGAVIDTIEVVRGRIDHLDDYFIYMEEPKEGWTAVVLKDGRKIDLATVRPLTQLQ